MSEMYRDVFIPIQNGWFVLRGRFPMCEADWNQMHTVLEAMRPGLVKAAEQTTLAAGVVEPVEEVKRG